MNSVISAPPDDRVQTSRDRSLLDELDSVINTRELRPQAVPLLRSLARVLLHTSVSMRQENIEPLQRGLHYLARRLASEIDEEALGDDPRYILGRIDGLLEVSNVAIDRSLSTGVLNLAKRAHVKEILGYLLHQGDSTPATLGKALNLKPNHLSNILRWMDAADFVRKVESGSRTIVALGPAGEAAYAALSATVPEQAVQPEAAVAAAAADQSAQDDLGGGPVEVVMPAPALDNLALPRQVLSQVRDSIIVSMRNRKSMEALGIRPVRRALLYGPPGCGKTTLVRAIAMELGARLISIKPPHLAVAGTKTQYDQLINELRGHRQSPAPVVLWMDAIDRFFPRSGHRVEAAASEAAVSDLLVLLDDSSGNWDDLLFIGETRAPWDIVPAVLGKIDAAFEVPLPDASSTRKLADEFLSKATLAEQITPADVVTLVGQLDQRHLRSTFSMATARAFGRAQQEGRDQPQLRHEDLVAAYTNCEFASPGLVLNEMLTGYQAFGKGEAPPWFSMPTAALFPIPTSYGGVLMKIAGHESE